MTDTSRRQLEAIKLSQLLEPPSTTETPANLRDFSVRPLRCQKTAQHLMRDWT